MFSDDESGRMGQICADEACVENVLGSRADGGGDGILVLGKAGAGAGGADEEDDVCGGERGSEV